MQSKILVVDDYAYNRLVYGEALAELPGVEVILAATGQRALQLARQDDFALFLIDVDMPGMDGFELASLLRQEPRCGLTPIVFVTAGAVDATAVLRGYRMGAVDFVAHAPAHGEMVLQKARVFLQLFRRQQALRRTIDVMRHEMLDLKARLAEYGRQHAELRNQATHDVLTGLPNRELFRDRLRAARARATRNRRLFALAYLDLDRFKGVNDQHGHATGDALIVAAAERLTKTVRSTDTVARLGGDEFGILIEDLDSAAGAERVAAKVYRALAESLTLRSDSQGVDVTVATGASIGVAIYPEHSTEVEGLIVLADMAMYEAKRGGGGVRVYSGDMVTPRQTRLRLVPRSGAPRTAGQ